MVVSVGYFFGAGAVFVFAYMVAMVALAATGALLVAAALIALAGLYYLIKAFEYAASGEIGALVFMLFAPGFGVIVLKFVEDGGMGIASALRSFLDLKNGEMPRGSVLLTILLILWMVLAVVGPPILACLTAYLAEEVELPMACLLLAGWLLVGVFWGWEAWSIQHPLD